MTKTSGYTLLSDMDARSVLQTILASDRYLLLSSEELATRRDLASCRMVALARRISKAEDDTSLLGAIKKSCWWKHASDVAQVQLRCKSQKEPGQVWFRVITGNAAYKYKSLAAWVSIHAKRLLRQHGNAHLVLSGVDFTRRLKRARFSDTALLAKLDLKDFYLEGWHRILAGVIGPGATMLDKAFFDAVVFLLSEQYAQCGELDPENLDVYHVQKGVGQGLLHAGDLADLIWFFGSGTRLGSRGPGAE